MHFDREPVTGDAEGTLTAGSAARTRGVPFGPPLRSGEAIILATSEVTDN